MLTTTSQAGNLLETTANRIDALLGAGRLKYLLVVTILCFAAYSGYSHAKVPWEDEVLQVTIARQPTLEGVWNALKTGYIQVDPPLLHVTQHYLFQAFGEKIYLARLPSILGFTLMCLALSLLVWRHAPPVYAAATFFMPYLMGLRWRAMDARPYGLLYGFTALALLCWDGIESGKNTLWWRIGFTFSFAIMLLSHFYSILVFLPLALGEAMKWYVHKRPDWKTWLCGAIAMAPYGLCIPTLLSANRGFIKGYYYKPVLNNLLDFFGTNIASYPVVILLVLLAAILIYDRGLLKPAEDAQVISARHRNLLVLTVGFLLIPTVSYIGAVLVTKLFAPYYHYVALFGLIIGIPLLLSGITGRNRLAGLCLLSIAGGYGLFVTARGLSDFGRRDAIYPAVADLRKLTGEPRPDIVIASPFQFLPFYETDRFDPVNSLVYLYDVDKAYKALGTDTADKVHYYIRPITTARIGPFDEYLASHKHFYIASFGGEGLQEWQFEYLLRNDPGSLTWLGKVQGIDVYRVDLEKSPLPAAPSWP